MPVSGGGIFVNYRRDGSQTMAELIDRDLAEKFGRDQVFLDCRSIRIGDDYARKLLEQVRECRVLLVIIGPAWLSLKTSSGARRIDDPADWIHREIAEAFRAGVRVVPVLLDGTPRLVEAQLPAGIAALARCQHVVVRLGHTRPDVQELIRRLIEIEPRLQRRFGRASLLTVAIVLVVFLAMILLIAIAIKLWSPS
ncbi:toll/interleukin-1 receptor domain-containing protein [Amycolatopsis sp. cmx-4-68]|uniref:toll/interleukin-1 receptor domain-containing protein n=1 Tax=Amycolatopsis sp. cmx-4-68 TaxID=2790938 RepID=UPI003978EFAB